MHKFRPAVQVPKVIRRTVPNVPICVDSGELGV